MSEGLIVGTAGHIDHGKTSLVRVLTGHDLDQLPEEVERGITIALGFTALDLEDGRRCAFVDVPGHERLVRTMIAGATGIDAVLLCVSAVDGVMPQTREHLDILTLVGVKQGAVVLTMADLVDEEMLELAQEDVSDAVEGTFLQGAPILPFSAVTLAGREDVVAAVSQFTKTERATDSTYRLPVDRTFVRSGFGTVATGTSWSGTLTDGAQVTLLPEGRQARVRGIQTHGEKSEVARAGQRTALNLAGIERSVVPRGTVVVAGDIPCPSMIDVRYLHLESSAKLDDGAPVRVLLGTAERLGRIYAAEEQEVFTPGTTTFAQIRLDGPLPCLHGDRFVVRRTSPVETLGGGEVVDPYAPRMRKKNRLAWGAQLERLHGGDVSVWLERAGDDGLSPEDWQRRPGTEGAGVLVGDRMLAKPTLARLTGALLEALASYHAEYPLSLGAQRRELRRGRLAHVSERLFDALVERLSELGSVDVEGPMVRIAGYQVKLTDAQETLRNGLLATIVGVGVAGILPKEVHTAHPEPEVAALLRLLELSDKALQVTGVGWISAAALDGLRTDVAAWFAAHEELSPGDFKEITGLTRKAAIPLLEWLDRSRLTVRHGSARRRGAAIPAG
jgi:selenocysteine-specific elongation factor